MKQPIFHELKQNTFSKKIFPTKKDENSFLFKYCCQQISFSTLGHQYLTRFFQCNFSLTPENIRKPEGFFLIFSGGRERVHGEHMD